jgi:HK97 family phage major capsid protein
MASDTMKLPSEVSMATSYWVAPKTAPTASDPVFGQVTLTTSKLFNLTNPVGNELLADSSFDIVSLLTEQLAYAQGQEYDNQYLNGTGAPCSGVLTAKAGYSVSLSAGKVNFSSVAASDLRSAIRKISSMDAVNGKFVYSKDIQFYIDTLVDTTGRFIYRAPGDPVAPGRLWGRDVIESAKAPAEADSGTGKAFAIFGDLKQFYIGIRKGQMSIDIDPYSKFTTDETQFRMITRAAMNVARASAFCRLLSA